MADYPTRKWFVPKSGIAREVITADIQRYLGPDATVKPGMGDGENAGEEGYIVTAYRTLTSQMIRDLQSDSQRWRDEVAQKRVAYQDSGVHKSRQHWGPSQPVYSQQPQQPGSSYSQQAAGAGSQQYAAQAAGAQQQYAAQAASPQQYAAQAAHAAHAAQNQRSYGEYTHTQPVSYAQSGAQYMPPPDYTQGQVRTTPQYGYQQPAGSHAQYYGSQQQEAPRYTYTTPTDPSRDQAPTQQSHYGVSQQPSGPNQYYQQQPGGSYSQPPQQNERRRR